MNIKIALYLLLAGCLLVSCKKATELTYGSADNIYLDFPTAEQRDSVIFTFANEPAAAQDTVWIPVRLSGIRENRDRKFIFRAEPDSSTAVVNLHYQPFKDTCILPANAGSVYVPIIVYNKDTMLLKKSVTLKFRLFPSADLGTNIPDLIYGKLVFSCKLERPDWWGMWFDSYYSTVKHELFIIVTGQTSLTQVGTDAPKNLYFVSLLNTFLNDPFSWVKRNADKGFVIEQRSDGNYDFYNTQTPNNKFLYQQDPLSGKYYFIDENGQQVQQ